MHLSHTSETNNLSLWSFAKQDRASGSNDRASGSNDRASTLGKSAVINKLEPIVLEAAEREVAKKLEDMNTVVDSLHQALDALNTEIEDVSQTHDADIDQKDTTIDILKRQIERINQRVDSIAKNESSMDTSVVDTITTQLTAKYEDLSAKLSELSTTTTEIDLTEVNSKIQANSLIYERTKTVCENAIVSLARDVISLQTKAEEISKHLEEHTKTAHEQTTSLLADQVKEKARLDQLLGDFNAFLSSNSVVTSLEDINRTIAQLQSEVDAAKTFLADNADDIEHIKQTLQSSGASAPAGISSDQSSDQSGDQSTPGGEEPELENLISSQETVANQIEEIIARLDKFDEQNAAAAAIMPAMLGIHEVIQEVKKQLLTAASKETVEMLKTQHGELRSSISEHDQLFKAMNESFTDLRKSLEADPEDQTDPEDASHPVEPDDNSDDDWKETVDAAILSITAKVQTLEDKSNTLEVLEQLGQISINKENVEATKLKLEEHQAKLTEVKTDCKLKLSAQRDEIMQLVTETKQETESQMTNFTQKLTELTEQLENTNLTEVDVTDLANKIDGVMEAQEELAAIKEQLKEVNDNTETLTAQELGITKNKNELVTVKASLEALEANCIDLATLLDEEVGSLDGQVSSLDSRVSSLEPQSVELEALNDKLKSLQDTIEEKSSELSEMEKELSSRASESDLADQKRKLAKVKTDLNKLQEKQTDNNWRLTVLNRRLTDLQTELGKLDPSNSDFIKTEIGKINAKLTALESARSVVQTSLSQLREDYDDLKALVDSEKDLRSGEHVNIKTKMSEIEGTFATLNAKLTELTTQVRDHEHAQSVDSSPELANLRELMSKNDENLLRKNRELEDKATAMSNKIIEINKKTEALQTRNTIIQLHSEANQTTRRDQNVQLSIGTDKYLFPMDAILVRVIVYCDMPISVYINRERIGDHTVIPGKTYSWLELNTPVEARTPILFRATESTNKLYAELFLRET